MALITTNNNPKETFLAIFRSRDCCIDQLDIKELTITDQALAILFKERITDHYFLFSIDREMHMQVAVIYGFSFNYPSLAAFDLPSNTSPLLLNDSDTLTDQQSLTPLQEKAGQLVSEAQRLLTEVDRESKRALKRKETFENYLAQLKENITTMQISQKRNIINCISLLKEGLPLHVKLWAVRAPCTETNLKHWKQQIEKDLTKQLNQKILFDKSILPIFSTILKRITTPITPELSYDPIQRHLIIALDDFDICEKARTTLRLKHSELLGYQRTFEQSQPKPCQPLLQLVRHQDVDLLSGNFALPVNNLLMEKNYDYLVELLKSIPSVSRQSAAERIYFSSYCNDLAMEHILEGHKADWAPFLGQQPSTLDKNKMKVVFYNALRCIGFTDIKDSLKQTSQVINATNFIGMNIRVKLLTKNRYVCQCGRIILIINSKEQHRSTGWPFTSEGEATKYFDRKND
jgi:hypothetical protein